MTKSPGDMIQIHTLASFSAVLLNRDDAGLAKRKQFGSAVRTRISSQCLKKRWRESDVFRELGPIAIRSRRAFQHYIVKPLVADHGVPESEAVILADYLIKLVGGDKALNAKKEGESSLVLVLGDQELAYLLEFGLKVLEAVRPEDGEIKKLKELNAYDLSGEEKKNFKLLPKTFDMAAFGRMVTGDLLATVDSAVSVAHSLTTHASMEEADYFTAVDTLMDDGETGAGHLNEAELTSGVFYTYVTIDMNGLRANLGDQADRAEDMVRKFVRAIATVSPGAKKGSTAPYSPASFLLVERGSAQPRSLSNAFERPVPSDSPSIIEESAKRLLDYRRRMDGAFEIGPDRAKAVSVLPLEGADDLLADNLTEAIEGILSDPAA